MKNKFTYIDLGLPSGRLWATENAKGYYTYDKAKKKFGGLLPSPEAFKELWENCQWLWDIKNKRMVVIGLNKNTIFLPALGCHYGAFSNLYHVGSNGYYWLYSSNNQGYTCYLNFNSEGIFQFDGNNMHSFSVRLCKEQ